MVVVIAKFLVLVFMAFFEMVNRRWWIGVKIKAAGGLQPQA
jgi:hypothetical protein